MLSQRIREEVARLSLYVHTGGKSDDWVCLKHQTRLLAFGLTDGQMMPETRRA